MGEGRRGEGMKAGQRKRYSAIKNKKSNLVIIKPQSSLATSKEVESKTMTDLVYSSRRLKVWCKEASKF